MRNTERGRRDYRCFQRYRRGYRTGLCEQGARLVLAARNLQALQTVANECERLGAEAIVVRTDVTNPSAVNDLGELPASAGMAELTFGSTTLGSEQSEPLRTRQSSRMTK